MKARRSQNCRLLMAVLFGTLFALTSPTRLPAQSSSDFSTLRKHIDKQVTVETQDGQITGRLLRVEDNTLVVYEAGTPKPIARESVQKVTRHKSRHTAAWIAGMSAAGLGTGFLLGFRSFDDARNSNAKVGASALVGAGAGAAAGYALSRIGKQNQVVYQKE